MAFHESFRVNYVFTILKLMFKRTFVNIHLCGISFAPQLDQNSIATLIIIHYFLH